MGTHADLADAPDSQQIGQNAGELAFAGDHHVLGGSGGDMVKAVAWQPVGLRNGACVRAEQAASRLVDRGQPGPLSGSLDQQMMRVQGRNQGRQTVGRHTCAGGHGIQGADIQASIQSLDDRDLCLAEPVQDDPGVGAQAQLNRPGSATQRLHVALETGSAAHGVPPVMGWC